MKLLPITPSKKFIIVIIFIVLLVIGLFVITYLKNLPQFAKPVGILKTTENKKLQANINSFMEKQKTGFELGKDNFYCANHLYGFDEWYAYAWVVCSGFIVNNNEIRQGSAFSIPTRLEYKLPDFQIVNYKQPKDGSLYGPTLQEIFPQQFYDQSIHSEASGILKLEEELRSKIKK